VAGGCDEKGQRRHAELCPLTALSRLPRGLAGPGPARWRPR
jgi:hypothetical protein